MIATFGVILIISDLTRLIWGETDLVGPRAPGLSEAVTILGHPLPQYDLALIVLGPLVLGATWLIFHRTNGDWVYQAGGTGGGASFSQDAGQTWRKVKHGLAKNYGVACAADPQKPEVWYVSVAPGPGKAYGAQAEAYLYRNSGGAGWQPIGWGKHPLSSMPIALVTHPEKSGTLYAGLTNGQVWHSEDYGAHWQQLPVKFCRVYRTMLILSTEI